MSTLRPLPLAVYYALFGALCLPLAAETKQAKRITLQAPDKPRSGMAIAPPNFVFIITDDQDTYSISAYRETEPVEPGANGNPYLIDTPNIDRIADEGMLFHSAHIMGSTTPAVCKPSRTMLMTGRYLWHNTVSSGEFTLPAAFNAANGIGVPNGYDTFRTCKLGNTYPLANAEFDIVFDANKRGAADGSGSDWHADHALDFLNARQAANDTDPFFLFLGFSHPHDARLVREDPDLLTRYGCVNTNDPASITGVNPAAPPLPINHLPLDEATGIGANYPFHPFDHGDFDARDEIGFPGMGNWRTEAVTRNEIGRNFGCVDWIDRQMGRVFAELEEQGLWDNTYIIYVADHGIAIGRHGLSGKQNLYEHTWKIPMLVRGPGIAAGVETDAMVYLHDMFPTLCNLAGPSVTIPSTIGPGDALSFHDVLLGNSSTHRSSLYGVYRGGDLPGMRSVKIGRWKMIKYDVADDAVQETQLFDLLENPFELLPEHGVPNLARRQSHALIRQELEEVLMQNRVEVVDFWPFLGDRTLLRFEGDFLDRLPYGNDGTSGTFPPFSTDVPNNTDYVVGEPNTQSADFEQDSQHRIDVPDSKELDFGDAPFTIEAWVKLETLPLGADAPSTMPLVMKRTTSTDDVNIDYMFLATAGVYGGATDFDKLALVLGGTTVLSSLSITDQDWHHISASLDPVNDKVRFTIDAQSELVDSTASGLTNAGALRIGIHLDSSGNVDYAYDGLLDELSITDGFLDPSEMQPLRGLAPADGLFRVNNIVFNGDNTCNLTFDSNEAYLYDLEQCLDLKVSDWTTVRSFIGGATGATETTFANVPMPAGQQVFFRVARRAPSRP